MAITCKLSRKNLPSYISNICVFKILVAEQISQKLDMMMQGSQNYIIDYSTEKIKRFLQYVKQFFNSNQDKNDMKCIVFVQRRYTAKLLYHILKRYDSNLKSDFIVGVNNEITESVDFILSNKSKRCVSKIKFLI